MNEYDSARMRDLLEDSHDLVPTENPEEADVLLAKYLFYKGKSPRKGISSAGRWKHLKQKNPDLVIGVGGCVASQEGRRSASAPPMWTWCLAHRPCIACLR